MVEWKPIKDIVRKPKLESLKPDTIMKYDNDIYVLDAKYYRIGNLPLTSDVHKQITYGEYAYKKFKKDNNEVYNAFILPYDSSNKYTLAAEATANWKNSV